MRERQYSPATAETPQVTPQVTHQVVDLLEVIEGDLELILGKLAEG